MDLFRLVCEKVGHGVHTERLDSVPSPYSLTLPLRSSEPHLKVAYPTDTSSGYFAEHKDRFAQDFCSVCDMTQGAFHKQLDLE